MARTWSKVAAIHRVLVLDERDPQRGRDVEEAQKAYNTRARHRGLPTIKVDSIAGPKSISAFLSMGYALGALKSTTTKRDAKGRPVVTVGLQRMIRYPAARTPAQLSRARARQPEIGAKSKLIQRADWGARAPRQPRAPIGVLQRTVVHHTAALAALFKSAAMERAHMRLIQEWHFARGFSDIGYHRVTFPSGRTYAGRPIDALGAGVTGFNTGTVHYCLAGNFEIEQPTKAALAGVGRQMRADGTHKLPRFGHYELQANACPGRNVKPHIKELA